MSHDEFVAEVMDGLEELREAARKHAEHLEENNKNEVAIFHRGRKAGIYEAMSILRGVGKRHR